MIYQFKILLLWGLCRNLTTKLTWHKKRFDIFASTRFHSGGHLCQSPFWWNPHRAKREQSGREADLKPLQNYHHLSFVTRSKGCGGEIFRGGNVRGLGGGGGRSVGGDGALARARKCSERTLRRRSTWLLWHVLGLNWTYSFGSIVRFLSNYKFRLRY